MMPSAPPENLYDDEAAMLEHYRQQHLLRSSVDQDALYAQRLQQEEQDRQYARDMEEQLRREEELRRNSFAAAIPTSTQVVANDEAVARDMAQQLQDEDVARQFALAEERALAARVAEAAAQPATTSCRRRLLTQLMPCLCVLGGAAVIYLVLSSTGNADVIPIPGFGQGPFLSDSDPFDGLNPWEVARWRNGGTGGLQLTVVNALEESWNDVFPVVVADWDNGVPDALSLSVEAATAPDFECDPIEGKSKVCNGDYGDTQWKGINLAVLERNYIVASSSKMNEFYLKGASTAQKRYTLCHGTYWSNGRWTLLMQESIMAHTSLACLSLPYDIHRNGTCLWLAPFR
jgi:hypothetical protein